MRGNERRTLLFTVDSSQPALGSQIDLGDPVCLRGTSSRTAVALLELTAVLGDTM
jgi:hypothetical protein